MMDVSIVIINWNTKEFLQECLNSVLNQKGLNTEIIIVDNNSSDGSVAMLKEQFPQLRLIANRKNFGFARANNQAIKKSKGRYILLLNSDTVVGAGAIAKLIEFMDAHTPVGIAGGKLLNPNGSLQLSCYNIPTLRRVFFDNTFVDKIIPFDLGGALHHFAHDKEKEVGYVSGACFMIRRELLDEIGLFDEQFFMYSEEADLCFRARKKGWQIYFNPEAQITHYNRQSALKFGMGPISAIKWRSNYRFFRKHYGSIQANLFAVFIWFIIELRIFLLSLVKTFSKDRAQINEKIKMYKDSLKDMRSRPNIVELDHLHMQYYTGSAKEYDWERFHSAEGKLFAEIEDKVLTGMIGYDFLKKSFILDVAAGTGRVSASLAKKGANVIAVDQAINMLCEAQKKAHDIGAKTLKFTAANSRSLPFKDNTFNVVTSIRFLTIIPPEYFNFHLDEMKRVLKKGGLLLVEFNNKLNLRELIMIKGRRKNPWPWQINQAFKGMKIVGKRGCWFPGQRRLARRNRSLSIKLSRLGGYFPFFYFTSQVIIKAIKE